MIGLAYLGRDTAFTLAVCLLVALTIHIFTGIY